MDKEILVDTDIIIKSYRGSRDKYNQLELIKRRFAISIVTAFELFNGAKNIKRLSSLRKELKTYSILHLDTPLSEIAFLLYSKYSTQHHLRIPDVLIDATSLRHNLKLYTDNKRDYEFIEGIKFYTEK